MKAKNNPVDEIVDFTRLSEEKIKALLLYRFSL